MTKSELHIATVLAQIEAELEDIKREIAIIFMFEEIKENY